jgi:hypothetical protein
MESQNDIYRNASLFTMNGLVDPRMMPGYVKSKSKKGANDISLLFRIRIAMHSFVGKLIFRSQS